MSDARQYCSLAINLENSNSPSRLFNILSNKKPTEQFANMSQGKYQINTKQNWSLSGNPNPYALPVAHHPDIIYLTPAIFGSAAGFILGLRFFGHNLTAGYPKFIFFVNIYGLITSLGVGVFIYESRVDKTAVTEVLLPALLLMFFFGTVLNLTYSLYPDTFSGTIGNTPITQFISFLSLSIANISAGETLNVVPEKPGVQMLLAIAGLFSLFVFSIIISLVT